MFHLAIMLGISLAIVMTLVILLWLIYLFDGRISIIDIGWGLGFVLTALTYFALGEGFLWRRLLVLTVISIWALRLTFYLVERFQTQPEDLRYHNLIKGTKNVRLKVLSIYLLQGFLITLLSIPFALMSENSLPFFETTEVFGLLLWVVAVMGEAIADDQLYRFKSNPANAGKICDQGWWYYSRHPNYFFEWLIWIAYCIMALSSPWGWTTIFAPILMLYLLLRVSGIPLAEEQALKTKGEAYQQYQRRTSSFIPWFKRK